MVLIEEKFKADENERERRTGILKQRFQTKEESDDVITEEPATVPWPGLRSDYDRIGGESGAERQVCRDGDWCARRGGVCFIGTSIEKLD